MIKNNLQLQLQVSFIKEGNKFIAHSPALDISTSGDSLDQAKKRFEELSAYFLEECVKMGTLEDVLVGLGWHKKDNNQTTNENWVPPTIVGQESHQVKIRL
jgi:hypothetical protein